MQSPVQSPVPSRPGRFVLAVQQAHLPKPCTLTGGLQATTFRLRQGLYQHHRRHNMDNTQLATLAKAYTDLQGTPARSATKTIEVSKDSQCKSSHTMCTGTRVCEGVGQPTARWCTCLCLRILEISLMVHKSRQWCANHKAKPQRPQPCTDPSSCRSSMCLACMTSYQECV